MPTDDRSAIAGPDIPGVQSMRIGKLAPLFVLIAIASAAAATPPIGEGSAAPEANSPSGLSSSDWSSIRAAYEAGRHKIVAVENGWRARNPGQRWITTFDERGFTTNPDGGSWSWGLELVGYGWGEPVALAGPARSTSADGRRLSRDWDGRITEWYVNDRRGLEHGFAVAERPGNAGEPLTLDIAVRGALAPTISTDGRNVSFTNPLGGSALNYSGLTVLDAGGLPVNARWKNAQSNGLRLVVDDTSAQYPLTIDPVAQQAYLKASNTGAGDQFGYSVAISGDTVVIGTPGEDSNATGVNGSQFDNSSIDSGAAYVFVRNGLSWSQQAYVKPSNSGPLDNFGSSVAISGNTIVVGSPGEDSSSTGVNNFQGVDSAGDSGAAYVFERIGTTWSQQAYLKASNTDADDRFGYTVGISGDTIVVGAGGEDSIATGVNGNSADDGALDSGAAYVFVRAGTSWSQQAYLKASNTGAGDNFGTSVAVSGNTIVIGASGESSGSVGVNANQSDNSSPSSGAAYVFARVSGMWSQQAYLKPSNTGTDDRFGGCVSISGDTVVVGAINEDSSATGVNGHQGDTFAGQTTDNDLEVLPGQTVFVDTSAATLTLKNALGTPVQQTFVNGNIFVRRLRVFSGGRLVGQGPNPLQIFAVETVQVDVGGQILVTGSDASDVQTLLTAAQFSEPGGAGTCGGGSGGVGNPVTSQSSVKGGQGHGPFNVLNGGGFGGESALVPVINGQQCFDNEDRHPAGGGGGSYTTAGEKGNDGPTTAVFTIGSCIAPQGVSAVSPATFPHGGASGPMSFVTTSSTDNFFGTAIVTQGSCITTGSTTQVRATAAIFSTSDVGRLIAIYRTVGTWEDSIVACTAGTTALDPTQCFRSKTLVRQISSVTADLAAVNFSAPLPVAATTGDLVVLMGRGNNLTGEIMTPLGGQGGGGGGNAIGSTTILNPNFGAVDKKGAGGGGGGGVLQIQALGKVSVGGTISASGGNGAAGENTIFLDRIGGGSGGGSGGTIIIQSGDSIDTFIGGTSGTILSRGGRRGGGAQGGQQDPLPPTTSLGLGHGGRGGKGLVQLHAPIDPVSGQFRAGFLGAGTENAQPLSSNFDPAPLLLTPEFSSQSPFSATNSGAAYVFVRNGSAWSQQAYLKASNTDAGDFFGISVALSANTAVIGATGEASSATTIDGNEADDNAPSAGAAFVFTRDGSTWSQQAYLKAPNAGAGDSLGLSVAISGGTIVAGAIAEDSHAFGIDGDQTDNSAPQSGASYIFDVIAVPGNSGVIPYGNGTRGCVGPHELSSLSVAQVGNSNFALKCTNPVPLTNGLWLITDVQDLAGSDPFFIGAVLHVGLFTATELITIETVAPLTGPASVNLPIPAAPGLIGKTYFAQSIWAWPLSTCFLFPYGISTSNGLAITIQP
ncbi:MAG: FG-GAP repeat protein [Planctomycetes bacterium]|nr:FG-GAP repeat protein [Planctomycetota bacterium]